MKSAFLDMNPHIAICSPRWFVVKERETVKYHGGIFAVYQES